MLPAQSVRFSEERRIAPNAVKRFSDRRSLPRDNCSINSTWRKRFAVSRRTKPHSPLGNDIPLSFHPRSSRHLFLFLSESFPVFVPFLAQERKTEIRKKSEDRSEVLSAILFTSFLQGRTNSWDEQASQGLKRKSVYRASPRALSFEESRIIDTRVFSASFPEPGFLRGIERGIYLEYISTPKERR